MSASIAVPIVGIVAILAVGLVQVAIARKARATNQPPTPGFWRIRLLVGVLAALGLVALALLRR
jgi:Co/Zn/Cd efflux system component